VATPAFAGEDVDLLALLSDVNRRRLLENSRRESFPAGTVAFAAGGPGRTFVLRKGLVRVYWSIPDGREATVALIQPGNLVGGRNLVPGTAVMRGPSLVSIQVVVDSTLILLDFDTVRSLAGTEVEVVTAIATQLAARVRYDIRMIAVRTLGNITERLAFDLLERACRSQLAVGRLEARATHEDLAWSIGSSREVVSRALRGLRAAGIVETAPGVTRVRDPERLAEIVRTFVV
jgi:CRP/FNR family transcriptional regulator, cyclic AMP receptor protein